MLERKMQKVDVPTIETKQITVPTVAGLKHALTDSVESAQARGGAKLEDAKAAAAPVLAAAGAAVAPKLSEARDKIEHDVLPRVADTRDHLMEARDSFVEEALPKIVEAVTGVVAAGTVARSDAIAKVRDSDAVHRAADAAAVLKGDKVATEKKKSGGFLSGLLATLGLLAAAGALAWFFNKRAVEKDDPWARPLADPYVPPSTGRESSVPAGSEGAATGLGQDAPATFAPAAGQVGEIGESSDEPWESPRVDDQGVADRAATDQVLAGQTAADQAVAEQEIRVIDPMQTEAHKPAEVEQDERGL